MDVAVEQRQASPAKQLLDMRRHRALAHDDAGIDEASCGLSSGDDHGLSSKDVRAKDASVRGQPFLDEAERVPGERKRLAEERNALPAGRQWRRIGCCRHRASVVVLGGYACRGHMDSFGGWAIRPNI